MINFGLLKEEYEERTGVKLFNEEGELEDFYREVNKVNTPVCGTWHVNPIPLTAVRKPFCGIATVDIVVLSHPDTWEDTRDKMNEAAETLNGTSREIQDEYGAIYSVSYNCQTCSVANRVFDANIGRGEVFEIRQQISYIIIESGVSAYDTILYIDGMQIPFLSLVENKIHTTSIIASDQGVAQTMSEVEAYGIDFVVPFMKDDTGAMFRETIDSATGNEAHCVVVETAGRKSCHIMQFTHTSSNVQPPQNIGLNVSMTEIQPIAAKYNGLWMLDTVDSEFAYVTADVEETDLRSLVVFWGDGTADECPKKDLVMHVYSDGKASHEIAIFKSYGDAFRPISSGSYYYGKKLYFRFPTSRIYAKDFQYGALVADSNTSAPSSVSVVDYEGAKRFSLVKGEYIMYLDRKDESGDYYVDTGKSFISVIKLAGSISKEGKTLIYSAIKDEAMQKAGGLIGK
jgi:hypothetical protein